MKAVVLSLIRIYQIALSPFLGKNCRFYPSCSEYCHQAIEKYGYKKGLYKSVKRICSCHPASKGGIDFP